MKNRDEGTVFKTLTLLGLEATDRVTGFQGMVTCASFDVAGCIQLLLVPRMREGKLQDASWFDLSRVEFRGTRLLEAPEYKWLDHKPDEHDRGPANKPSLPGLPVPERQ